MFSKPNVITYSISSLLCILLCTLQATSAYTQNDNLRWKNLTSEDGLSVNSVNCLIQDNSGFMWLGTQSGLDKYDGVKFRSYTQNPGDSNGLNNSYINCIVKDKEGYLWIGTEAGGLNKYDPYKNIFTHFTADASNKESAINNNKINALAFENDTVLWIGTEEGICKLNTRTNKTVSLVNTKNKIGLLGGKIIQALLFDNDILWIGTSGEGLYSLDIKKNVFTANPYNDNGLIQEWRGVGKSKDVLKLFKRSNNELWIGTNGVGILFYNIKEKHVFNQREFDESYCEKNKIKDLVFDLNGTVWVGTYQGLINIDQNASVIKEYVADSKKPGELSDDKINQIYIDNKRNFWLANLANGINVSISGLIKFQHFKQDQTRKNWLPSSTVFSLLEDKSGELWVGLEDAGLCKYNKYLNEFSNQTDIIEKTAATNKTILTIFQDKAGNFWFGTYGSGVIFHNPKSATQRIIRNPDIGFDNGTILSILQTDDGLIWIATYGDGLFSINPNNNFGINHYTTDNGLGKNELYTLYSDKNHYLLIGTNGAGIYQMDQNKKISKYLVAGKQNNKLSDDIINHISLDKNGNYWISTSNGLNLYDAKTKNIYKYYKKDGLVNDYIVSAIVDTKNRLWMSTYGGISMLDINTLELEGKPVFTNYSAIQGVQGREFNQGAYHFGGSGQIYFGGQNGFNIFNPLDIKSSNIGPEVKLISIEVNDAEYQLDTVITFKEEIALKYSENNFKIFFAALDYSDPANNSYQYKLEGYDDKWSAKTKDNYAVYKKVPDGKYTLIVRAYNNEGALGQEYKLKITIAPRWYWNPYAFFVYILAAIGLIFAFTSWRTGRIKRENKILEDKVTIRTKELEEKNREVTDSIQYAKRIQDALLPAKQHIYKSLNDTFVLFKPKDIVSGDFYWYGERDGKHIIAAVDCTGHGVPGAFMSMIGFNFLSQIVQEKGIVDPGQILSILHQEVVGALQQTNKDGGTNDGMDIAICSIDKTNRILQYAGAYRPLVRISNEGNVTKIDGNKFPIGGTQFDQKRHYDTHTVQYQSGDACYMFTDGYADQFGGPSGKKFMLKNFYKLLEKINQENMLRQESLIEENFENWRGQTDQVDDVLVIGIKLN
jgi:ligand-binding sensor domain-containing protein/serine phosphatase RsbU (regulator of sigma subunit)